MIPVETEISFAILFSIGDRVRIIRRGDANYGNVGYVHSVSYQRPYPAGRGRAIQGGNMFGVASTNPYSGERPDCLPTANWANTDDDGEAHYFSDEIEYV